MNRYWHSRAGGPAQGPLSETIILSMWERGEIQSRDMMCLEDTDDWRAAVEAVEEIQVPLRQERKAQQVQATRVAFAAEAEARLRRERKSGAAAFVLSLVFPGAGQYYASRTWRAGLWFLLGIAFAMFGPVTWVTFGLVAGVAAMLEAHRANKALAEQLNI